MITDNNMKRDDAKWLSILLDLKREPVGIKFLYDEEEYSKALSQEPAAGMPYCTAVRNASMGKSSKMNLEHMACLASAKALGLMERDNASLSGRHHYKMGVYKDPATSRSIAKGMVFLEYKVYGVEVATLKDYESYDPDVVIMITNPYNAMRVSQGYAYNNGHIKNIQICGMQGICQECTTYPFENNQVNFSMLCSGTRCVGQWQKDELGIGIPFNKLASIIDGLKHTSNHMDQNPEKKIIEEKLKKYGLENEHEIAYSKNYYTGVYGTKKQKEEKAKRKNTEDR